MSTFLYFSNSLKSYKVDYFNNKISLNVYLPKLWKQVCSVAETKASVARD